ncbi:MAG TPA: GGDEF domain-containing protein [Candidatus Aquabacterium excrementipullorum]|nr:GGDEF domain-containing protein [Candidatus Aquabacterium excrementipullorum]
MLTIVSGASKGLALPGQDIRALVDRGLKSSFWQLRLPDGLEQQYLQDSIEARVMHTQRAGWFALFVFNSFLLVDWLMVPDVFWRSVLIRIAVFSPLGIAVLLNADRLARLGHDKSWVNVADWMSLLSGWGAALSLAVILWMSHSPWVHYYHAGFLVIIIYGNLVQQLRFPFAIAFSLGVLALHVAGVALTADFPPGIRVGMVLMLLVTASFTLTANYLVERATRRRYLLAWRDDQMMEELSVLNARLQKLSRSDVLTGVANRRHFHTHLQQAVARAQDAGTPLSLLMMDVDHFKAYNDRYGHPAGDECLRQVATALQTHLRHPADLVARFGGEEFVVVMQEANEDAAACAADRLREAVQALNMRHEGSSSHTVVTISVGAATLTPGGGATTADKLVSCADRALYEAKRGGRNRVQLFRDS